MWITIGNEMWNLDKVEGIVCEDNLVIFIFPDHYERYEAVSGTMAESVLVDIEVALMTGQKSFSGLPRHLKQRDEDIIYNRFG